MDYEYILNRLYSNYYLSNGTSGVSSSYWRKQSEQAIVLKKGDDYKLSGVCFGAFTRRSAINHIKYFPQILMYGYLFKKYKINKRLESAGKEIAKKQNRILDFDCIKQMLSLDLILKKGLFDRPKILVVIGDGYGFMTSLIRMVCPEITVIGVNLGKVLFFDVYYTRKVLPQENIMLINEKKDTADFRGNSTLFLEAEKYQLLFYLPVDLFINIACMQEIDSSVVSTYFDIMRSSTVKTYCYSCNRIEKTMPDGTVNKFFDCPWHKNDKIIIDELCPWYQKYPSRHPPFWRPFDGPIWHRLAELYREKDNQGKA